jgi:hypothetical protein
VQAGRDFALTAFPLNSLCSTLTATINDTTSVINSQDVLKEVLRLTDYSKNRLQRTCPTMLDKYQSYNDAFGALFPKYEVGEIAKLLLPLGVCTGHRKAQLGIDRHHG